jgi:hypothetical protein
MIHFATPIDIKQPKKLESKKVIINMCNSSFSYHFVPEIMASGVVKITWVPTKENIAHIFTKH